MASSGKKGKKNKGKTVPLNDFLSNTTISWSDQIDEPNKLGDFNRKPALPAAPRAARALEISENKIPKNPPYVAYVSNLSYELQDGDIIDAFVGLNVANVRLPRDERSGRLKGFGYVEFADRDSFISALLNYEATIRGRRIKIDVAENESERRRGGSRDIRERDTNFDSEKTLGDWRSGPKRSDFSDDGRNSMSGRKDYSGFRDRDNYDKGKGGESSWRDSERRFGGDRDKSNFGSDRDSRSFGSHRSYNDPEPSSEPKTRTKLNLMPRTKPIEETVVTEESGVGKNQERLEQDKEKPSTSIFGQAKPVDTAAREREIEQRLEKEKEGKIDKELDKSKPKNEEESSNEIRRVGHPESKENVWVRKSQRQDPQNVTDSSGRKSNLQDSQESDDKNVEKNTPETADESLSSRFNSNRKSGENESDRDNDNHYGKNESRYNDRNREGDRSHGRDDRWRDEKDRRDRERRDHDRRDRGYDSDKRIGNSMGRLRERDRDRNGESRRYERDGDSKRYGDREGDYKRYNDRENDWKESSEKDGDNKRGQDRDNDRYKDQESGNKNVRTDRRSTPGAGEKAPRQMKFSQDRERALQTKEKPRDQKKNEDNLRLPKFKEAAAPNYIGTNKYSCLDEDGISE